MSNAHDLFVGYNLSDGGTDGRGGGLYVSTDKGLTWDEIHKFTDPPVNGAVPSNPVLSVLVDQAVPNRAYALVGNHKTGGVWPTDELDKGVKAGWTKLANPPRTEGHPWDIKILVDGTLVVSYSARRDEKGMTQSSGVFVSTDGGKTWADRTDPASASDMCYYTQDVIIDPRDAGQNTWYCCVDYVVFLPDAWPNAKTGVYKTTDRGLTWRRIFAQERVGARSLAINPQTNEMYLATSKGLWYSNNSQEQSPSFTRVADVRYHAITRVFLNPYKSSEVWVVSFGGGVMWGDAHENPKTAAVAARPNR